MPAAGDLDWRLPVLTQPGFLKVQHFLAESRQVHSERDADGVHSVQLHRSRVFSRTVYPLLGSPSSTAGSLTYRKHISHSCRLGHGLDPFLADVQPQRILRAHQLNSQIRYPIANVSSDALLNTVLVRTYTGSAELILVWSYCASWHSTRVPGVCYLQTSVPEDCGVDPGYHQRVGY